MAKIVRVEGQKELKCQADKFFDIWARKPYLVPKMCPDKMLSIELIEGDWGKVGAVKNWNYVINDVGEHANVKTRVEELDEEKRLVKYSHHDGLILKKYNNTLISKVQATPQEEGCIVKWSFEYEKMNEAAPEATVFVDFMLAMAKDIDACLCRA